MKKIITLFVASLLSSFVMAQQPHLEWAKNYGNVKSDASNSVVVDNDGNVYTAGYIMDTVVFHTATDSIQLISMDGTADIVVTKQDAAGNFIWAKSFPGPAGENAFSCAVDNSGNVYVTGPFQQTVDFDPGAGVFEMTCMGVGFDIFICKLDSNGDFVWAKQVGGEGYYDYGQYLKLDPLDGSIYVTGQFNGVMDCDPGPGVFNLYPAYAGDYETYVLKLNNDGSFNWAISFTGDQFDSGTGLALDGNGNLFVCGVFGGVTDFDPGAGEYILTAASSGYADGFVCKLNAFDGSFVWAVPMGSLGNDWCNSIAVDPSGNVLVAGEFFDNVDFDPGPNQFNLLGKGGYDIFVWKLDTDGNLLWAKSMGGSDSDWGASIAVDASGNAYTTGHFMTTADFDPGDAVYNLNAGAYYEVFISKLTSEGDFAWAMAFRGNQYYDLNSDDGFCIAVDADNNVYTVGSFESWVDVDPSSLIYYITAHDVLHSGFYSPDAFIHKLSQINVGLPEAADAKPFNVYPNPVKDEATVDLGSEYSYIQASLTDVTGKILAKSTYNNTSSIKVKMDVATGIYFLQLRDKNGVIANLKVVKE